MHSTKRFTKTDLARRTHQVVDTVLSGQTAVVESHGEPEVVILDIVDYWILCAVMRYHANSPEIDDAEGLSESRVGEASGAQGQFDLVNAYYLAGAISLSRAAELLEIPPMDLRTRYTRLDVPLRTEPEQITEVVADAEGAEAW